MFGWHIGTLSVYTLSRDDVMSAAPVFTHQGQVGPNWLTANVAVAMEAGDKLVFTGVRAGGYSGDIGLDSIALTTGDC